MGIIELPSGENFTPQEINDLGVIIGRKSFASKKANGSYDSWLEGCLISLEGECLNWKNFQPQSINNQNYMVGGGEIKYATNQSRSLDIYALLKFKEKGIYKIKGQNRDYPYHIHTNSINNKNEVVGDIIIHKPGILISHGFLWSENKAIDIGAGYTAIDINDNSQVILTNEYVKNPSSWLWENGNFINIWDGGRAYAINNYGVVI